MSQQTASFDIHREVFVVEIKVICRTEHLYIWNHRVIRIDFD